MRLTTTITLERELGGGMGTDGDESWDIPGRDVEVEVEVVGVAEWRPGSVTYDSIRVESIDGEVAAGWARGEREAARTALSWAADEQTGKEEEAA